MNGTCKVMGIVNVTPDSFSDGGKFYTAEEAVRRVRNTIAGGADIVDIGGESTRPGAIPIDWKTEWSRIEPVIAEAVRMQAVRDGKCRISVDTYHPETASRALALGAGIINCVRVDAVGAMLAMLNEFRSAELIMPFRMNSEEFAEPPTGEIAERIYIDPMIGFSTTREEDLALVASLPQLARRGRVVIGASRKRIVKSLVGQRGAGNLLAGSLAIAIWCAMNGASVVRVHDVLETVQALKVLSKFG